MRRAARAPRAARAGAAAATAASAEGWRGAAARARGRRQRAARRRAAARIGPSAGEGGRACWDARLEAPGERERREGGGGEAGGAQGAETVFSRPTIQEGRTAEGGRAGARLDEVDGELRGRLVCQQRTVHPVVLPPSPASGHAARARGRGGGGRGARGRLIGGGWLIRNGWLVRNGWLNGRGRHLQVEERLELLLPAAALARPPAARAPLAREQLQIVKRRRGGQ